MAGLGTWAPLDPRDVQRMFAAYDRRWWIAGGWAIDFSLGRQTRSHADVDVEVPRVDQLAVQRFLHQDWELWLASSGVLTRWVTGEAAPADTTDVWCRATAEDPWAFQLMFNPGTDATWVSKRDPVVTLPMAVAIRHTDDGVPYLAPEAQLLMKAKTPRPKDDADFVNAVGTLDLEARRWLRAALDRVHPGHAWSDALA